jgi:hypothetical protein
MYQLLRKAPVLMHYTLKCISEATEVPICGASRCSDMRCYHNSEAHNAAGPGTRCDAALTSQPV